VEVSLAVVSARKAGEQPMCFWRVTNTDGPIDGDTEKSSMQGSALQDLGYDLPNAIGTAPCRQRGGECCDRVAVDDVGVTLDEIY
jgi:hypothetical protein